jgi:peptide/nickel transport system permease protein
MLQYIVRRLVYGAVTLLALSIIVFTLLQNTGGGPLDRLKANPRIRAEDIQRITEHYGLDQPAWKQYFTWVWNYVQFWDQEAWGESFQGDGYVRDIIADRVFATLRLMLTSLGLAVIVGIPLGVFQALRQYSFFDQAGTTFSFVTFSMPIFVLAVTLQLLLAVYLEKWTGVKFFFNAGMNSSGYGDLGFWARIGDTLSHLFLPAISIALISIAGYSRYQRASMLDVLHSDYLRTAKAKGLSRRSVIVKHALRNALIPIVTLVSLDVAAVLGGAVITESIFGWPGIGRKYIEAITTNDYPVVMAVVMAIGIMTVAMNLFADIAYGFLDPRVRYD